MPAPRLDAGVASRVVNAVTSGVTREKPSARLIERGSSRPAKVLVSSATRTPVADVGSFARNVPIGLTTPQGTRSTRKLADLRREAGTATEGVRAALERARLIVRSAHGVTLAHEALLTQGGAPAGLGR